jgi:hypothetical protein
MATDRLDFAQTRRPSDEFISENPGMGAIKAAFLPTFLAILFGSVSTWAGPPFQTDDRRLVSFLR